MNYYFTYLYCYIEIVYANAGGSFEALMVLQRFSLTSYFISPAPCSSSAYQKNDGKYYCTFAIKDSLTWYQADDACKLRGGWLPEVYSVTENINIVRQKVLNHLTQ